MPPVERIDILYTSPAGPYELEVAWHPGGSGREAFNVFLDDVLVASSRTRDGALEPYLEETERVAVTHTAGRHVLSIWRISGDGLHFGMLRLAQGALSSRPTCRRFPGRAG
jgi:hypothetical protein